MSKDENQQENNSLEVRSHSKTTISFLAVLVSAIAVLVIVAATIWVIVPVSGLSDILLIVSGEGSATHSASHSAVSTSLYESIITFLVAINAVIAGVSILYIKSNSEDKLEEIVADRMAVYFDSKQFAREVDDAVEEKGQQYLKDAQVDLVSMYEKYESAATTIDTLNSKVLKLENEATDLRRLIGVLSRQIAMRDMSEEEGSEGSLEN